MIRIEIEITEKYNSCRIYDKYENIIFSSHKWDTESTLEFMQRMIKNVTELSLYKYLIPEQQGE